MKDKLARGKAAPFFIFLMMVWLPVSVYALNDELERGAYESPRVMDLVYFKGKLLRDQVLLTWMSAVDLESDGFSIEMKMNNQSWEKIGWIEAPSESTGTPEYKFLFEDLMTGQYYFRLVQEDIFGVETYSNVVSLHFTGQPNSLVAFPDKENTFLYFDGPPVGRLERVMLFDFSGNLVLEKGQLETGQMVPVAHLASGQYMLECEFDGIRARTHVIL